MAVSQNASDPGSGKQWKTFVFWCWIWREANAFILGNCTNHLWKQPSPESLTGKNPATAEAHFEHFLLGGHQDIVWVWSTHLYLAPTGSACLLMAKPHLSSKDPNLHTNDGTSNMVTWWPFILLQGFYQSEQDSPYFTITIHKSNCWRAMAAKRNSSFSQSHKTIGSQ